MGEHDEKELIDLAQIKQYMLDIAWSDAKDEWMTCHNLKPEIAPSVLSERTRQKICDILNNECIRPEEAEDKDNER